MFALSILSVALAATPATPVFPGNGHRCQGSQFATGDILPLPGAEPRKADVYVVQITALLGSTREPVGWIYVVNEGEKLVQFTSRMPLRDATAVKMKVPAYGYSGIARLPPGASLSGLKRVTCRVASSPGAARRIHKPPV